MLEKSLAQFVSETREKVGLSQSGLAKKSNLPLTVIEDVESGQELFLSSTFRQKLAKGLKLNPSDIKPYEKFLSSAFEVNDEYIVEVKQKILNGDTESLTCPICSSLLFTRVARLYDLEDNLILHPKATCTKCPFQIR